eukprot:3570808-Rhodomonas_salina.3
MGCDHVVLRCDHRQTGDCPMWLNFGKFLENGSTGQLKLCEIKSKKPKSSPKTSKLRTDCTRIWGSCL